MHIWVTNSICIVYTCVSAMYMIHELYIWATNYGYEPRTMYIWVTSSVSIVYMCVSAMYMSNSSLGIWCCKSRTIYTFHVVLGVRRCSKRTIHESLKEYIQKNGHNIYVSRTMYISHERFIEVNLYRRRPQSMTESRSTSIHVSRTMYMTDNIWVTQGVHIEKRTIYMCHEPCIWRTTYESLKESICHGQYMSHSRGFELCMWVTNYDPHICVRFLCESLKESRPMCMSHSNTDKRATN